MNVEEYVHNQTDDICKEAVKQNIYAIVFVQLDFSDIEK